MWTGVRPRGTVLAAALAIAASFSMAPDAARAKQDFAMPSPPPPRLELSILELAGHELRITDENGTYVVQLKTDGTLSGTYGDRLYEGKFWTMPDGRLCLVSDVYWVGGFCFWAYGHSAEEIVGVHPYRMKGKLFPAEVRP